jgi:chemotaxis response regulator CheB
VFSGLGKDGSRGCQAITRNGGFVWVQSSESCVIPNMPDAVRRCCEVELSGSPEELARALATRCQAAQLGMN